MNFKMKTTTTLQDHPCHISQDKESGQFISEKLTFSIVKT